MRISDSAEVFDSTLTSCLDRVRPLIDDTIDKLARTKFREDPVAGRRYSRLTSIISSAYKRHGQILERTLLERLKDCARFDVWQEGAFKLSHESLEQLRTHDTIERCLPIQLPYGDCDKTIPIDMIVFDKETGSLGSYNVKRGNGSYDAGKRRMILGEILRTNMLLLNYGRELGFSPNIAEARIVFYYGLRSIPEPLSLIGDELDDHFRFPVVAALEHANDYFKRRLHAIIEEE